MTHQELTEENPRSHLEKFWWQPKAVITTEFCHQNKEKVRPIFVNSKLILFIINWLNSRYEYSKVVLEHSYTSLWHCKIHFKMVAISYRKAYFLNTHIFDNQRCSTLKNWDNSQSSRLYFSIHLPTARVSENHWEKFYRVGVSI